MNFSGRACGKFILSGEHFVVPEHAFAVGAIAFPLKNIFCELTVCESRTNKYNLNSFHPYPFERVLASLEQAMRTLRTAFDLPTTTCFDIHCKTNIPIARGFGSSAAFSLSLVRAFIKWWHHAQNASIPLGTEQEIALEIEKIFHGSPSGIDTQVLSEEKIIYFHSGKTQKYIHNACLDFILIDSGPRESCSSLISKTRALKKNNAKLWERLCVQMQGIMNAILEGFEENDVMKISEAIQANHAILKELELSHEAIEQIIHIGMNAGALAGKVSGAGQGGAVLLACRSAQTSRILEELKRHSLNVITTYAATH